MHTRIFRRCLVKVAFALPLTLLMAYFTKHTWQRLREKASARPSTSASPTQPAWKTSIKLSIGSATTCAHSKTTEPRAVQSISHCFLARHWFDFWGQRSSRVTLLITRISPKGARGGAPKLGDLRTFT